MRRIATLLLVALASCASGDAEPDGGATAPETVATSTTPSTTPPSSVPAPVAPTTDPVPPEGFDTVGAVVTKPDGSTCELCLWLADDGGERARGLMFVTELGGPVGMAFRYPSPHTGTFWMKNTLLPLSIVFYSPDGEHVGAFDMEPCAADPCPRYPTPSGFLVAVEVPQGELADHGLVAGSRLELLDTPCNP